MPAIKSKLILSGAAGCVSAFLQTGCAHSPLVWHYYDECTGDNQSFVAMAECGKKKRLAECAPNNSCSPEGNVFVEYIDSLAQSVKDKKMTDAEAMRRYAEYKSGGATRCTQVGGTTKCY
jgi:hypothetical protein